MRHLRCFSRAPRQPLLSPTLVVALGLLSGCAAIDPRPDLQRSAAIVSARTRVSTDWTQPWEAAIGSWDGSSPLSADAAAAMALRNNRELRAEVEQIAMARADLAQAGLLPNPMLTLALRVPFDPVEGGAFLGGGVMQSFVSLWLRSGKVRAADAALNQTVLNVSDRALRVASEVRATHARIGYLEQELGLVDEDLASSRRTIEILEARVRGGEGTALDVNRARQLLAASQSERLMATRELANQRLTLLELIGFPTLTGSWSVAPPAAEHAASIDEDTAVRLALSQRLDVAASAAVVETYAAQLSVEELSRIRELSLGLDIEREHGGAKAAGPVLSAPLPIFDSNQAQIARAGAAARAAFATHEAVSQRAIRESRTAWSDYANGCLLIEHQRTQVLGLAADNLALAEAALRAGQADVTVFLEAQREVIRARRTLLTLKRDTMLADIELERAVGGLIPPPTP